MFGFGKKKTETVEIGNIRTLICHECDTEHPINLKRHTNKNGSVTWFCPKCGALNGVDKL